MGFLEKFSAYLVARTLQAFTAGLRVHPVRVAVLYTARPTARIHDHIVALANHHAMSTERRAGVRGGGTNAAHRGEKQQRREARAELWPQGGAALAPDEVG